MRKTIIYIIPLHKKDDKVFRALSTVTESKVVIATTLEIAKWVNIQPEIGEMKPDFVFSENTSYAALVNAGIDFASEFSPDYISFLEFDDQLTPRAENIINEYADDFIDADILAPIAFMVKGNKDENMDKPMLVGLSNEACFAPQVFEEFGYYDYNTLLKTNFVFVNGCYFKPKVFKDFGKFKTNFEIFCDYEFILRMIYNGAIIRGIPKACRYHFVENDSMFEIQKNQSEEKKQKWLLNAKKEYFFAEERQLED